MERNKKSNANHYPDVDTFWLFVVVCCLAFAFGDKTLGFSCLAIAIGWEPARRVAPSIGSAMIGLWLLVAVMQIGVVLIVGYELPEATTAYLVSNILSGLVISTSMRIREENEDETELPYGIQISASFLAMIFTAAILLGQGYVGGVFMLFVLASAFGAFYRITSDWHVRQNRPERIAPIVSLWRLIRPA